MKHTRIIEKCLQTDIRIIKKEQVIMIKQGKILFFIDYLFSLVIM